MLNYGIPNLHFDISKATDADDISPKMLKLAACEICDSITKICFVTMLYCLLNYNYFYLYCYLYFYCYCHKYYEVSQIDQLSIVDETSS